MSEPQSITHRDLMLATSGSTPFDRAGWVFELKYDGFRVLAIREGPGCRLMSRRGNDLSPCFPEIVASLGAVRDSVLDGELVVLDEHGRPDFERLRRRALTKKGINVAHAARAQPAAFFAFDVLVWRSKDVRSMALLKRKEIVQAALDAAERIRAVQYIGEQGRRLYDAASGLKLEGIVAKLADSTYRAGRSRDWIKIRTPHGRHVQEERSEKWNE